MEITPRMADDDLLVAEAPNSLELLTEASSVGYVPALPFLVVVVVAAPTPQT